MPTFKDQNTGLWYCKFYYADYTGKKKQKKKMGFRLQREAKEWEKDFLERKQGSVSMTLGNFSKVYLEDVSHRLKQTTTRALESRINNYILPYFKDVPVNEITPQMVRQWQNDISKEAIKRGSGTLKPTSLKIMDATLSGIFAYAEKYYYLPGNPCKKAGSIGSFKPEKVSFWTVEEFQKFIDVIPNRDITSITIFTTLFYTGMRISELLALTPHDIDINKRTISITKNYHRISKKDVITSPKTPKSKRTISIPPFIADLLQQYTSHLYSIEADERIFITTNRTILNHLKKYADAAELKPIKVHDLRHSHASMLIEMGFSPLMIADRLGHENVSTTLNRYSHLYPSKQEELTKKLEMNKILVPF
jgi:integrase